MQEDESRLFWVDFAIRQDVHKHLISYLDNIFESFSDLKKLFDDIQKVRLMKAGIEAKNPSMYIFLLKANHGFTDRPQIEIISGGESITSPTITII